jgi:hypothetical protein
LASGAVAAIDEKAHSESSASGAALERNLILVQFRAFSDS